MDKIKNFLSSINFIVLMFLLVTGRAVIEGAGIGDAIAVIALCSLYGFKMFLDHNKKQERLDDKVQKELDDMKVAVAGIQVKNNIKSTQTPVRFF